MKPCRQFLSFLRAINDFLNGTLWWCEKASILPEIFYMFLQRPEVALLLESSSGYARGLLAGITAYVREHGHWSVVTGEPERLGLPPQWLRTWRGDGIIARIETRAFADHLRHLDVPVIDLSETRYLAGIPWSQTDDAGIAALAASHFTERRFQNLAFCGDPGFAWSELRRDRFAAITAGNGQRFFEFKSVHRYAPSFDWGQEKERLKKWLATLPRPVGIFACYDFLARQILEACHEIGLPVPESAAVLGVDDDALVCNLAKPPLSSIAQDTYSAGYSAAQLLDRLMVLRQQRAVSEVQHRSTRQVDDNGAGDGGYENAVEVPIVVKPLGVITRESTDTIAIEDVGVASALQYIRRNFRHRISVSDVLQTCSLSRRSMDYRFKKLVGRTPHEEIQRVRLNYVKQLLATTRLPITMIARRAGFEHSEYMTAVFRRVEGTTPTKYRQSHRDNQR